MVWSWIPANLGLIGQLTRQNAYIGIVSAVAGLVIAVPLGIASARWRWLYPPVLSAADVIYALPSLALFVVLIAYTGLSDTTVIIPLTLFSLVVILPNVVDGLRSVPGDVRQAATAMGFGPLRRLAQVELPLAVPVIIAGMRVATVSSISLVSVGQLIGIGGLGYLFTDGLDRDFPTEIYVGLILIIVLALACDLLLVLARRLLTPWQRDGQSGGDAAARLASPAVQAEPPPRAGQAPLHRSAP
jgi:osmoprotectant transport system permease protein